MKKIIYIIIITIILMKTICVTNEVNAMSINENSQIVVSSTIEAPYSYMNVERGQMKVLKVNGNVTYALSEEKDIPNTTLNNNIKNKNAQLDVVLKYGYPYKTVDEMYCQTEEEAYLATQEAIFTVLYNKNVNYYTHRGESGWRIRGAIARIMRNVDSDIQNKEDTNKYNAIEINEVDKQWIEDSDNENYNSKQYNITVLPNIVKSSIKLEGGQDVKILNENNLEKTTFTNTDTLKILIPKDVTQNFNIKLSANLQNYENYISMNTQNVDKKYLIVEKTYTNVEKVIQIKNGEVSTIKIINLDNETKDGIQGNTFELLDKSYKVIRDDIITDENGEFVIPNIKKDKYYLRQTSVVAGYSKNGILIELEVNGQEEIVKVNINNCKTNIIEENTYNKEVNVTQDNIKEIQNNTTDVSNVYTKNLVKETNNQINEINHNNINYFDNIITNKNETNYKKIINYKDVLYAKRIINILEDADEDFFRMNRKDMNNYLDIVTLGKNSIPKLPVASK